MILHYLMDDFSGGVISRNLINKLGLNAYRNALFKLVNGYIDKFGNIAKRPGTYYCDKLDVSYDDVKIIPFIYNDKKFVLILVLDSNNITTYVYDGSNILNDSNGDYITLSFDNSGVDVADLKKVFYAQKDNKIYIAVGGKKPFKLHIISYDGSNWSIDNFSIKAFNMIVGYGDDSLTKTDFYLPNFIGNNKYAIHINIPLNDGSTATADIYPDGNVVKSSNISSLTVNTNSKKIFITTSAAFKNGEPISIKVDHYDNSSGSDSQVDMDLRPYGLTFYNDRLVLFGGYDLVSDFSYNSLILGSSVGDYLNFTMSTESNQAFMVEANTTFDERIETVALSEVLFVGTNYSENVFSDLNNNLRINKQTNYGSAPIQAKNLMSGIIFVHKGRRKIYEFYYDYRYKQFVVRGIDDYYFIEKDIIDLQVFYNNGFYILILYSDGSLGVYNSFSYESIAYSDFYSNDNVKSICVVDNTIYLITEKNNHLILDRLADFYYNEYFDTVFLDHAIVYDGSSTNSVSVPFDDGDVVSVFTDKGVHPDVTVSNGKVTLNWDCNKVVVGYKYKFEMETTTIDFYVPQANLLSVGKPKSIKNIYVYLYKSLGGSIGVDGGFHYFFRKPEDLMNRAIELFTGNKKSDLYDINMVDNLTIEIQQDLPVGFNINSIAFDFYVGDV